MSIHNIQYEGIEIEYELSRKNVKYINLRVNKYGKVVVSAGKNVPFEVIDEFVQSKAFWIITHLAEIEKIKSGMPDNSLYDGKTVYYLGRPYQLVLERGERRIFIEGDKICLYSPKMYSDVLKEEYLAWLKNNAEKKFEEIMDRIYPLVAEYRIKRPEIKIRNMKSIWGSCTTTGKSIRLNLQLMKAEEECIEQVVLHELLHFRYPNHGKSFYDLLAQLMPDWKERKEKLETQFKDGI
ncbi:M48 family metallopeptidase [Anaerotignum sp.]|nr:SprT family zinc-dependent metalloprotease [Anaerotignum sp.]MBQ7758785.1 M48 family metallopeptidase [Anaerotignum sp.]